MSMYIAQSDTFDGYETMDSESIVGYEVEYLNAEELDILDLENYVNENMDS